MSKHTPEPWNLDSDDVVAWIDGADGESITEVFGDANARRIVACVNACAGMDEPAVAIARLRAENARLREALEKIVADSGMLVSQDAFDFRSIARAALAGAAPGPKEKPPVREWVLDRYHNGIRMAEGARVNARTLDEAIARARRLFPMKTEENDVFKERPKPEPKEEP